MWLGREEGRGKQEGAGEIGPPWAASLHSIPPGSKSKALGDSRPTPWGQLGQRGSHCGIWAVLTGPVGDRAPAWAFPLSAKQGTYWWEGLG